MRQKIKKHSGVIISIAATLAVLVFAFIYGGKSPSNSSLTSGSVTGNSAATTEAEVNDSKGTTNNHIDADSASNETSNDKTTVSKDKNGVKPDSKAESTISETTKAKSKDEKSLGTSSQATTNSKGRDELSEKNVSKAISQTTKKTVKTTAKTTQPKTTSPTKDSCTISISCATILNNMDKLKKGKESLVPSNGWILGTTTVYFEQGDTVYDVLQSVCRSKGIHMESSFTPMYNSVYIEGINNLYEFDCGSLSGWNYSVNGHFPNYSCSQYTVKSGDSIKWAYTCNLGKDVGGTNAVN